MTLVWLLFYTNFVILYTKFFCMLETAVFAGGCFWCLEAVFQQVKGVEKVVSGYAGGHLANPSDMQVYAGKTGHAEVVQIEFDSGVVSFRTLLEIFFTIHDPTSLNKQGNDVGMEYRSAVFYLTPTQQEEAVRYIKELADSQVFADPIVTEVSPYDAFYPAAEYHQDFFQSNPQMPYCQIIISPKIKKFHEKFGELLKSEYQ